MKQREIVPWFRDLPLDFARVDTRVAEEILIQAYPMNALVLRLAENVGLNLGSLPQMALLKILVRSILQAARKANRLLRLMAEVIHDPEQEAYANRLSLLLAGHEGEMAAEVLRYVPSLSLLAAAPPAVEIRSPGEAPVALARSGQLEKTVNVAAGFAEIAGFRRGLVGAEIRTARILAGGHPRGTGFLVGDQLLLTNWHVVATTAVPLVAQFDHKADAQGAFVYQGRKVAFATDWQVASSPHAAREVELSPEGPHDKVWDYALVRLAEPIGAQPLGPDLAGKGDLRGSFALDGERYSFLVREPVLIVGHPEARPMQLSYAAPSGARFTTHATRIRYQTNTEPGSSGSPVFNKDWRVVALHHAGGPTSQPGTLDVADGAFNQGIPIADIVDDLKSQLAGRPDVLAELRLQ